MRPTAPRGVLRTAILHLSSLGILSGTDVAQWVEKVTEGLWKPGPGSIYFLLNELESQGYIRTIKRESRKYYIATGKGREELRRIQKEAALQFNRQIAALLLQATILNSPLKSEIKGLFERATTEKFRSS